MIKKTIKNLKSCIILIMTILKTIQNIAEKTGK